MKSLDWETIIFGALAYGLWVAVVVIGFRELTGE